MKRIGAVTTAALSVLVLLTAAPAPARVAMTFDHYYDGPAVEKALRELAAAYPQLATLQSLGKSEEGRDVWCLTINNPKTGQDTDKPGIYVDGAIHGNEIQATEVCLYLAWYLLDSYDRVDAITDVVDTRAFYIVPTVNVDGRWRFFEDAGSYSIGRTARVPHDDDRDGLIDEDDYEDIDGDGEILQMRIRDPFGGWKSHPDDPRVMVRVDDDELGEWRIIGREGIDNDGDGRLNEDTPGYLDMNRNYGFKWQPMYVQSGAGEYPMSARPTKAVSDFIVTKPNICFNYAFHNMGGMFLRGPGSKLAGRYSPRDLKVYDYLGKEAEKIVPGYRYLISSEDLYTTHGDFDEWMFSNLGTYGFVGELFMSSEEQYDPPKDEDEDEEDGWWDSDPQDKQKFNDRLAHGQMFREWKPFDHPQYGKIEIGGWRTFTTRIGPVFKLLEMAHRNASAVIFTAQQAPDVQLEVLEVKDLGGDLRRIRVRATNLKAIPTLSQRAVQKDLVREDILRIEGRGIEVVSGGLIDDLVFDRVEWVEHRPQMIFTSIPSFGHRDVQWIVRGRGTATVRFNSIKAIDRSIEIQL